MGRARSTRGACGRRCVTETRSRETAEPGEAVLPWWRRWGPRFLLAARTRPHSEYDAFISYSHDADSKLAPILQRALHGFARPWYRLRALRVFRDISSLAANAGLMSEIESVLLQARFLILLASPGAAQSRWVAREVDFWCQQKKSKTLLIVLTAGDIRWSDDSRDFDWNATTALPKILAGRFAEEPLLVDLRWARTFERLGPRHPELREATATLAAAIHERPRDELIGEDLRRHRRAIQLAVAAGILIVGFGAAATWQSFVARAERDRAREQAQVALSRQLAAESAANAEERPDLALLLSLEAYRVAPTVEATGQLMHGLQQAPEGGWQLAGFLQHAGPIVSARPVSALAFSRTGRTIVGARDRALVRWNATTQKRTGPSISTDLFGLKSIVFERGTGVFVAAGEGGVVRWRPGAATATTVVGDPLASDLSYTSALVVGKDGRELVQGTDDGELVVTDLASGDVSRRRLASVEVTSLALSHDGRLIAAGTDTGGIVLWDQAGDRVRWIRNPPWYDLVSPVSAVAFAPGDRVLAAGSLDNTVSLWTVAGRRLAPDIVAAERIGSIAFSPDGRLFAWGDWGGEVGIWDMRSGTRVGTPLHGQTGEVHALAFAPDNRMLASATDDGTIALWETGRPRLGRPMRGTAGDVDAVAFTNGGELVTSSTDRGGEVTRWGVGRGRVLESFVPHRLRFPATTVSADGSVVGLLADDGTAFLFDVRTRSQIGQVDTGVKETSAGGEMMIGPDNRTLAVTTDGRSIVLARFGSGRDVLRLVLPHDAYPDELAFSPDRRTLVASHRQRVFSWDVRTGDRTLLPVTVDADSIHALAFSPDGTTLATGTSAGSLSDGSIILWRLDGGKPARRPLPRVRHDVRSLTFSPDGRLLAAGTEGGPMLWDVASAKPLGNPLDDGKRADHIAFSPDGQTLASADGIGGGITVWSIGVAKWRRIACELVGRNLSSTEWTQYLGDRARQKSCDP